VKPGSHAAPVVAASTRLLNPNVPTMTIHYAQAARRHHNDATVLLERQRVPNADHLYGFAAECALVGIIRSLDGTDHLFDADGEAEQREGAHVRQHVNALWNSFWHLVDKHHAKTTMKGVDRQNPFSDWAVQQRYFADEHWSDVGVVHKHRDAATQLLVAMQEALIRQAKKAARCTPPENALTSESEGAPEGVESEARGGEEQ
jgi:hypothetical protein